MKLTALAFLLSATTVAQTPATNVQINPGPCATAHTSNQITDVVPACCGASYNGEQLYLTLEGWQPANEFGQAVRARVCQFPTLPYNVFFTHFVVGSSVTSYVPFDPCALNIPWDSYVTLVIELPNPEWDVLECEVMRIPPGMPPFVFYMQVLVNDVWAWDTLTSQVIEVRYE